MLIYNLADSNFAFWISSSFIEYPISNDFNLKKEPSLNHQVLFLLLLSINWSDNLGQAAYKSLSFSDQWSFAHAVKRALLPIALPLVSINGEVLYASIKNDDLADPWKKNDKSKFL